MSRHDLLLRFVRTARTFDAKVKEVVSSGCILGAKERLRSEAVLKFLLNWDAPERSKSFEDYWQKILMKACDAVLRAPQRLCQLSRAEELNRWIWSLRNWDDILYLSMGSDKKWLAERVIDVDKWLENLSKTRVLMSDQIPYWVKIGRLRALYDLHEVQKRKKLEADEERPGLGHRVPRREMDEDDPVEQTRQKGQSDDEKYRVTYEACQCLDGLWTDGPLSVRQLKPVVVFPGAYARLSNIREDGTFKN